jgi:acetyl-CoA acetyltransferase
MMTITVDLIITFIEKLIQLITAFRVKRNEGAVQGVGDTLTRVIEIVKAQDRRTDLAGRSKDEANHIKRNDAITAMRLAGINLKEGDLRRMVEDALLVKQLLDEKVSDSN